MNKSDKEIRLDLLAMAQNILNEQNMNERIRLENDWGLAREKASIAISEGKYTELPPFPPVPQYNADDVIAMAEKLNAFVSKAS